MNLRADLALMLSGHTTVPPCLLFRQADGLRLDGCITLLVDEGQSLALSSLAEAALDHYADLLLHRLRRAVNCPVEVYFPASTLALVQRFEELVARMTLHQAMALVPGAAPERIWLVHEAGALAPSELQLLMRLVGNFPGAGVRVVLLFGATAAGRKGFESPGRRFARWDIQPPSNEEATSMLALARLAGGESLVLGLLSLLGLLNRPLGTALTGTPSPATAFSPASSAPLQSPSEFSSWSASAQPFQPWQLATVDPLVAPVPAVPALPVFPASATKVANPLGSAVPAWLRWPAWLQVGSLGRPPAVRDAPTARTEPELQTQSPSSSARLTGSALPSAHGVVQDVVVKPLGFPTLGQRARMLASRLPLAARLLQLGRLVGAQVRARLRRLAPQSAAASDPLPVPVSVQTPAPVSESAQKLPPTFNGPRP